MDAAQVVGVRGLGQLHQLLPAKLLAHAAQDVAYVVGLDVTDLREIIGIACTIYMMCVG